MQSAYIIITFIFIQQLKKNNNLIIIKFIIIVVPPFKHIPIKKSTYMHYINLKCFGTLFYGVNLCALNENLQGKVSCYYELHSPKRIPLEYHLFLNIKFGLTLLN